MTSTANDTQQNQPAAAPLSWTSSKEWGVVGLTHRAITEINGETWKFTVDSPSKGQWIVRAWRDGDFALYREDRTMKGAKQQAQEHVNYAATSTCDECREISGHTLACSVGLDEAVAKDEARGTKLGLRAEATEVQDEVVITLADDAPQCEQCDHSPHEGAACDPGCFCHLSPASGDEGPAEIGPAVLKQLDPAEAQQLMAELEETFPHLAEWKARVVGDRVKRVTEQLGQLSDTMATQFGPAVASAAEVMADAVRRVQEARDRVQMRKDTCGCPTPLHTMRCGFGGRVRVVRKAGV